MKLLASDFDNTLLFHNQMKSEDIKMIHHFQKQGHLFGVCTGRTLKGVIQPSIPYHIDYDFYILHSGALILNKDKDIIFEKQIPMSIVLDIFQDLHHQDASVVYQGEMYLICKEPKDNMHGIHLQSFAEIPAQSVSAFSFHFQEDEILLAKQATQFINEKYGHHVIAFQNNEHVDLACVGCSKGNGIKIIQDYFHINDKDVFAIGDSWNDLPMFQAVQNSYTFPYADVSIQQLVKKIVASVGDCIQDIEKLNK